MTTTRALWPNTTGSLPNPYSATVLFLLLSRRWWDYQNNAAATTL
ncbi:hypothetical protein [Morganella morganii]|nr:hypothetical protein [Morganella morganii]